MNGDDLAASFWSGQFEYFYFSECGNVTRIVVCIDSHSMTQFEREPGGLERAVSKMIFESLDATLAFAGALIINIGEHVGVC